jgi:serine/threonine protein kinase
MGYTVAPADAFSIGVCMFMMLTARPAWQQAILADPFFNQIYSRGDAGLEKYIDGVLKMRQPSASAMDLMVGLLKPDPHQRLATDAASGHEWFHQQGYAPQRAREQPNHSVSFYAQRLLARAVCKAEIRDSAASTLYIGRLIAAALRRAATHAEVASFASMRLGSREQEEDPLGQCIEICSQPSCLRDHEESDPSTDSCSQSACSDSSDELEPDSFSHSSVHT